MLPSRWKGQQEPTRHTNISINSVAKANGVVVRRKKCAVSAALQSNGTPQLTPETRESDTSSMAGGLSGARERRFTLDPLRDWRVSWRPPGPNAGVFPFEGEHTTSHWQLTSSSGWLV